MRVEILRAQYNSRQGKWRIVKKTEKGSGGWKMFGGADGYLTKSDCEEMIDRLVMRSDGTYKKG